MQNNKRHVIGLMSGTSLDGVDIVYTSFNVDYKFEIIHADTIPYTDGWKQKLKNAFNQSSDEIEKLDIEYGVFLGELINTFITDKSIEKIDFITSHGHTIFHKPEEGYTLQIGDGEKIAAITNQKVVCDFRTQDVELGGQGAPLVPIGDQLLFAEYDYCLNLGGFANISFDDNGIRKAFDICPVNIVMNHYANQLGLEYDDGGKLASEGEINNDLFTELNQLPFYKGSIPKSLGYEFVVSDIFPLIDKYNLSVKDVLRTFVAHTVLQISKKITSNGKLLITGGGAFNSFMIGELDRITSVEVVIPSTTIINFKEALIFAFLGLLRIENKVNCLQSVTGAKKDHSSGVIYIPN
ncbi:MAG: anhydro-N-acetylmuramic acid kinase [Urechidicola sp.]|nr:anhydro-N-acetylmuramic acid kinase [Urechidicola sp.]